MEVLKGLVFIEAIEPSNVLRSFLSLVEVAYSLYRARKHLYPKNRSALLGSPEAILRPIEAVCRSMCLIMHLDVTRTRHWLHSEPQLARKKDFIIHGFSIHRVFGTWSSTDTGGICICGWLCTGTSLHTMFFDFFHPIFTHTI